MHTKGGKTCQVTTANTQRKSEKEQQGISLKTANQRPAWQKRWGLIRTPFVAGSRTTEVKIPVHLYATTVMKYEFIEAYRSDFAVIRMFRALEINGSGYFRWRKELAGLTLKLLRFRDVANTNRWAALYEQARKSDKY